MRWCPSSADRRCDEGRNHGHKRRPEQSHEPRDNHCGAQNDLQSDSILLGNPRLPTLDDEGRSVDAPTTEPREQGQVIPNLGDGIVPLGSPRFASGEELFRAHDLQLDENALKWWSRNTSDKNTKGDRHKTEGQRDTPLATRNGSDSECRTTNKHDKDLTTNFYKPTSGSKFFQVRETHR